MRILIIGYGKMGQAIEKWAVQRGHTIAGIINVENANDLMNYSGDLVDVAIEFTQPDVAVGNIEYCLNNGIPVISGTTGWQDKFEDVKQKCLAVEGTFLYASNFSLGVNLFFQLNKWLARRMDVHPYEVSMEEIHHIHKKDAPSGTAITLADALIHEIDRLKSWTLENPDTDQVHISAIRKDEVPGTHSVKYRSEDDEIEIRHEAFTRMGFVKGAVLVAEWIADKKGCLTMDDFMTSITKL